jgi:hypothetical protein
VTVLVSVIVFVSVLMRIELASSHKLVKIWFDLLLNRLGLGDYTGFDLGGVGSLWDDDGTRKKIQSVQSRWIGSRSKIAVLDVTHVEVVKVVTKVL